MTDKARLLKQRYGERVKVVFECLIVTPMFLGDATQSAALRPEPFKGLLRYWWRVAAGRSFSSLKDLLDKETEIFGGGGEQSLKSLVEVEVEGKPRISDSPNLPPVKDVFHPEVGSSGRKINPLLYLGYGPVTWKKGKAHYTRSYLEPGERFSLILSLPKKLKDDEVVRKCLLYFRAFGAAGSRSRNGWGSFEVVKVTSSLNLGDKRVFSNLESSLPSWKECFDKEFPHSLARDHKGVLLWGKSGFASWHEAMSFLAKTYIYLRTGIPERGYSWPRKDRLDPDGVDEIAERHLLGFPLTHHPAEKVEWGKRFWNERRNKWDYKYYTRLSSPLRFFLKKKGNKYGIFILHLPYYLDPEVYARTRGYEGWLSKNSQINVWQKVHDRLDKTMQRARINECL